jgi:predicted aconitase
MQLTKEEQDILQGKEGKTLSKVMQSVVQYGSAFGARRLVPIDGAPHLVTSFGANVIKPYFAMVDELIEAGLQTKKPFTVDPRPIDYENVKCSMLQKLLFKFMYGKQKIYERQMAQLGLKNSKAFTCTCYLPEVGNIPQQGATLAWSESSAVVFANSVLGARTNRNSAGIDLLCNILGKAPFYGLLTNEGRQATWLVLIRTPNLPNAQLLGSAIGMKVVEDVPYIVGLDRFLGTGLNDVTKAYLKDMGAAAASNGAVGLYHVENITPEAGELGLSLVSKSYKKYIIDAKELDRVMSSYPILWKDENAKPQQCFIGCPHLSLEQILWWSQNITTTLKKHGQHRIKVETMLCAAPNVLEHFKEFKDDYDNLIAAGLKLTSICPLMYMNNPLSAKKPIITNSNKLRTYSTARFFQDAKILHIIVRGHL